MKDMYAQSIFDVMRKLFWDQEIFADAKMRTKEIVVDFVKEVKLDCA